MQTTQNNIQKKNAEKKQKKNKKKMQTKKNAPTDETHNNRHMKTIFAY